MMETLFTKTTKKVALIAFFGLMSLGTFAQVTYNDTVCAETQDKVYGITGSNAASTYNWYISNPAAGVIDNSITANDSEIQIDWGVITGMVSLYAVETTSDGCIGDSVTLDILINPLPTVAVVSDSVCEGFSATLTFSLTGAAPWIIDYTDGTTNFTDTAVSTPYVATLPPYVSSQTITVTALSDANGCSGDAAGLPTVPVIIHPTPVTGPIYHY